MRSFLLGLLAVAMMLPSVVNAADADTLVWGRGGDSVSLDLAQATDGESIKAGIQVLENLVIFGKDSMDVEPQLAESWSISEDGLVWTFKLRKRALNFMMVNHLTQLPFMIPLPVSSIKIILFSVMANGVISAFR
jgi:ABC-type transport system substrate-binding protein